MAPIEADQRKQQSFHRRLLQNAGLFRQGQVGLGQIGKGKEELETQLMEKMERWEYLMEKAEQIAQQK